jgi:hypothetical protein
MDWNKVSQLVLQALLAAALPVVVQFLVDWLRAKTDELMLGLDQQTRWAVNEAVEIAVRSAGQSGLAGLIEKTAEAKKHYACEFAARYLARFGIKMAECQAQGLDPGTCVPYNRGAFPGCRIIQARRRRTTRMQVQGRIII